MWSLKLYIFFNRNNNEILLTSSNWQNHRNLIFVFISIESLCLFPVKFVVESFKKFCYKGLDIKYKKYINKTKFNFVSDELWLRNCTLVNFCREWIQMHYPFDARVIYIIQLHSLNEGYWHEEKIQQINKCEKSFLKCTIFQII